MNLEMCGQRELADNWNRESDAMWKSLQCWLKRPNRQNYRKFKKAEYACSVARARFMAGRFLENRVTQ